MPIFPALTVSLVTYAPSLPVVEQTLATLGSAVDYAKRNRELRKAGLIVVDNGPGPLWHQRLAALLRRTDRAACFDTVELLGGHGNVGYGAGHNLAIARHRADFHLVLNPDVLLEEACIFQALRFMAAHPDAGLLAPAVADAEGRQQYLCKRYPAGFDLLLRGFAPAPLKKLFRKRLERYELRDMLKDEVVWDVPLVSGCFMFFRHSALAQVQGFSPAYFLYFEDFDLSLCVAEVARIAYVPAVRITHLGGGAARKGWRHVGLFLRSLVIFFNRHGWKWF